MFNTDNAKMVYFSASTVGQSQYCQQRRISGEYIFLGQENVLEW